MPVDVTESATFPDRVQSIADGEPLDASHLMLAAALLADRTRFLYETLLGVAGGGARRLRQVPSIAALKAIAPADRAAGDVVLVPMFGLYVFDAAAAGVDAPPFTIAPTVAPGGWFHALHDVAGSARGLATLDASGMVSQPGRGTVVGTYSIADRSASSSAIVTSPIGTFVDVAPSAGAPWVLTGSAVAEKGDVLMIDAAFAMEGTNASTVALKLATWNGTAWVDLDETLFDWAPSSPTGGKTRYSATTSFVMPSAGTPQLKIRGAAWAGAGLIVTGPVAMRVVQVRP